MRFLKKLLFAYAKDGAKSTRTLNQKVILGLTENLNIHLSSKQVIEHTLNEILSHV